MAPDRTPLYDFSYACYGHDLCWQNGTSAGTRHDLFSCHRIFLAAMREHCDRAHTGLGPGFGEQRCFEAAQIYFTAVQGAALKRTHDECPHGVDFEFRAGPPPRIAVGCR